MIRFQKFFGGIELGGNGFIKNAVIEQLEKDPSTLTTGRIWYNTTEACFKMVVEATDVDGNKKQSVEKFSTYAELEENVNKLAAKDAGKGAALVGYKGKTGANNLFKVDAGDLEATLDSVVDGIDSTKKSVEDLSADTADKIDAVKSELDNVEKGTGLDEDGNYVADSNANYIKDATSLADADSKLDSALKSEVDRATKAENDIAADVKENYLNKNTTEAQTIKSPLTLANDVVIHGDLKISTGKVTEVETEQLKVGDNIITLNSDVPSDVTPSENAGIEVNRGKEGVMPLLIWNEKDGYVQIPTGEKDSDGNFIMAKVATGGDADKIAKELDNVEKGAGLADDGSYAANANANYIANATSLVDADNKLDAAAKANADAISKEVQDRTAAVKGVQDELDGTQKGAGLADDGKYVANADANYIKDATSLADADNKLDAQVKTNADDIAKEVQDRTAADKAITDELDKTQAGAGLGTDGSYVANVKANYIANATSLADADNKLDAAVKANADAIVKNGADTANLRKSLNETRVTYEASDAATSYTITHNLNSSMIDVMVWVLDTDDNRWYNDQTVISIVDDNNIQIDLTSAAKIRATIVDIAHQF